MRLLAALPPAALAALMACDRVEKIGQTPDMSPITASAETHAMTVAALPTDLPARRDADNASLWSGNQHSLLGDRRAQKTGDILTVVIEIDDEAEFSNSSERGRSGSESMSVESYLGVLEGQPFQQTGINPNVSTNSSSASAGDGSTRRNEKLTLRVAATVIGQLPNGVLQIQGQQEVRVNFELRELLVTGYVRPEDISRQNEIAYDKIASARISYGGRGQITDVQQPRIGQQVTDIVMPF
ncbi:flagellar basal body L-ring protein FlgH [Maritimibacter sp. UBA3975]|uniref:flagellar basal body L-ring protein FlgH n=1 Tax=Maritimibacter sp. UBA3975 TaxID=1946833 RepID=UPI000C09E8D1|nr:flagellar basal body L-ring protein FlgH [Maritimibacter sp. UBA3975]MAM61851.1 flagellar basal body L-ring protein [Maritimibacter sp.]|tara:strand:- start:7062 stop:7784 length:723 start_codon:yes stop_codon:yes gene_type:complete